MTLTDAFTEKALRARLAVQYVSLPSWGWVAPALVLLLAGLMRLVNLAEPNAIVFD